MRLAIVVVAAAGCSGPFRAGSLGPGAVQLGCIDIAARRVAGSDLAGPVIALRFGNHCDHSVELDLAQIHVRGTQDDAGSVEMVPYDPEHEIGAKQIDAGMDGEEWIEYLPRHLVAVSALASVDVDVGRVEGDRAIGPRWIYVGGWTR